MVAGSRLMAMGIMAAMCWQALPAMAAPAPELIAPGVSRQAAIAVANKWSHEIIVPEEPDRWVAVKLATLLDPYLHELYASLDQGDPDFPTFVGRLQRFAAGGMVHLQHVEAFQGKPGNMPWGRAGLRVVYRRLLPSELRAMAVHTGKPSGACESLAYLFTGLLRLKGASADDVALLRLASHTVGVVQGDGAAFGTNNTAVGAITPRIADWYVDQKYRGVLGEHFVALGRFRLDAAFFESGGPLLERLEGRTRVTVLPDYLAGVDVRDREAIRARLYDDLAISDPRMSLLVRYAAQSLEVPDLSVYEEAAEKGPLVRALARKIGGTQRDILAWIEANIRSASIFGDGDARVQMPDQVIVYGTGHALDRALLARTILALRHVEATVSGDAVLATVRTPEGVLELR